MLYERETSTKAAIKIGNVDRILNLNDFINIKKYIHSNRSTKVKFPDIFMNGNSIPSPDINPNIHNKTLPGLIFVFNNLVSCGICIF